MTQSIRARVAAAIVGAASLAGAGIVAVVSLNAPANNIDLDCSISLVDGGPVVGSQGVCRMILAPDLNAPPRQCAAVMSTGGDGPFVGLDAGFPNAQTRVSRALQAMVTSGVVDGVHCEAAVIDAGPSCWCEARGSVFIGAGGKINGQAPGWRDALDAAAAGSIVRPGRVSVRDPFALRGGCRAHVMFGEDPCAGSVGLDGGTQPDGGP